MDEEWKSIDGWPGYLVSNHGRVAGRCVEILKPQYRERGGYYPFVDLRKVENGVHMRRCVNIHTLVAEAFLGPRPEDRVVHHKDGNRDNSHIDNLEYVTVAENAVLRGPYSHSRKKETA
ncbi:MAG: NUMOD4 motif-containing HNH endonuclease [Patescibacteria group bacterium]|jgi:hypothetical protein